MRNLITNVFICSLRVMVWTVCEIYCFSSLFAATSINFEDANKKELEERVWVNNGFDELNIIEKHVVRNIQTNPNSSFDHYLLSHIYVRRFSDDPSNLSLLKRATDLAQQSIDLDPNSDYGYVAVAEILDLMGQTENALQILSKNRFTTNKCSWRLYFMNARLQTDMLSGDEVEKLLERSLSCPLAVENVIIPYIIAIIQMDVDKNIFLNRLEKWNKIYPNNRFLFAKAILLSDIKRYDDAHKVYESISKRDSKHVEAYINDAIILYRHVNNYSASIRLLKKALELSNLASNPFNRISAKTHLANVYLRKKMYREANELYLAVLLSADEDGELISVIMDEYERFGTASFQLALIDQFLLRKPGIVNSYVIKSYILSEKIKNYDLALEMMKIAINLDPGKNEYYNDIGLLYYKAGKFNEAFEHFLIAAEIAPRDSVALYNGACVLAILKRKEEALAFLEKAISINSSLAEAAKVDQDLTFISRTDKFLEIISGNINENNELDSRVSDGYEYKVKN